MKIAVWIISGLLALYFIFVGASKAFASWEYLESAALGVPVLALKIAGFAELLGSLGLILPAATRILPILTPIAAAGLVVTMIGATIINIGLGLWQVAVPTAIAGLLSAFVAWARFLGPAKITPRATKVADTTGDA